jgi:hypothetical protein
LRFSAANSNHQALSRIPVRFNGSEALMNLLDQEEISKKSDKVTKAFTEALTGVV